MSRKTTLSIMNKYEYTTIISQRAQEIANGNPITIQTPKGTNPIDIAIQEYQAGTLPKKIKRTFPDGRTEVWSLNEFEK